MTQKVVKINARIIIEGFLSSPSRQFVYKPLGHIEKPNEAAI
jgi:hypothetical protein